MTQKEESRLKMWLQILINNWRVFAYSSAIIASFSVGYHQGEKSIQQKWDLENAKAVIAARETERNNEIFGNKIGVKYETGIKQIDDNFNAAIAGLHERTNGNLPSSTNPASKPNATTCRNTVYQENKRLRLELARQAEINTQRLISLQEWVKGK